jgi:hypothetical protein
MDELSAKTRPEEAIEAHPPQMSDALVAVMRRRHESQRGAVSERQRLAVQSVCEQDVVCQRIVQQEAGGKSIGSFKPKVLDPGIGIHARRDQLPVDIAKAIPLPTDPKVTPRGDAMKVRELLPSRH